MVDLRRFFDISHAYIINYFELQLMGNEYR